MKITIAGSVSFAKEELEVKKQLEALGHEALVTDDLEEYVNNPAIKLSFEEELALSLKNDIMRSFYKKIAEGDALLVCNYSKKGIDGYLGTSVLMEIGIAYFLNKKIFLLNDIDQSQNYALEIAIVQPKVINGDLTEIK